ncbi:MAG: hypothetical protein ACRDCE_19385 [Cetobacterium sp.]|uniref:hypothetical protein n=1 Tax=Cetobacterium sp. TaxID=2071632 RepID=UPI003EE48946
MMKKILLCAAMVATLAGCTDATVGKVTSYGRPAHVICYSGGVEIFNGYSTGKVKSEKSSDGYFFYNRGTSSNVEVSGDCVINYQ